MALRLLLLRARELWSAMYCLIFKPVAREAALQVPDLVHYLACGASARGTVSRQHVSYPSTAAVLPKCRGSPAWQVAPAAVCGARHARLA